MAKITRAQKEVRVMMVAGLLLDGYTRGHILRTVGSQFGISSSQVDKYIGFARSEIEEIIGGTTEKKLALLTSNLWKIYRNNIEDNPAISRQALMDVAKLNGLDRNDINIHVERNFKDVSDEELSAAIGVK